MDSCDKGWQGEVLTANQLRAKGKLVQTLYIPYIGGIAQIDMLLISEQGVFVIENKNYKAQITGTDMTRSWVANYGIKSYRFPNPVFQNHVHSMAVVQMLETKVKPIPFVHNVVIFNDAANIDAVQSVCTYKVHEFVEKDFATKNPYTIEQLSGIFEHYADGSLFMDEYHKFLLEFKGERTKRLNWAIDILEDRIEDYMPRQQEYMEIVERTREDEFVRNNYNGFREV